jgi:hypothetical protein
MEGFDLIRGAEVFVGVAFITAIVGWAIVGAIRLGRG